jgi:hypothetical protein
MRVKVSYMSMRSLSDWPANRTRWSRTPKRVLLPQRTRRTQSFLYSGIICLTTFSKSSSVTVKLIFTADVAEMAERFFIIRGDINAYLLLPLLLLLHRPIGLFLKISNYLPASLLRRCFLRYIKRLPLLFLFFR